MNRPIGPEVLYNLIFGPVFGEYTFDADNLKQIGVDKYKKTHGLSLLYNLVNFYIPLIVMIVVLLLILFISNKSEKYCFKCCSRPLKHVKTKLVWNSVIRFCIETYYTVCITMWIGLKSIKGVTS